MKLPKIKPFLWYNGQAEEAARFYASIFPGSSIDRITPGPTGAAMVVELTLAGVKFVALNGGPMFKFTEAVSFSIECETQQEIDFYWDKLCEGGGAPSQCGWLKDRFGLSWQVVPDCMGELMSSADPAKAGRVMGALMQMTRIDLAALRQA